MKKVERRTFFKAGGAIAAGLSFAPLSRVLGKDSTSKKNLNINIEPVHYRTSSSPRFQAELGLGFNWFEHLGAGGYYARWKRYPLSTQIYPDMDDKKGWAAVEQGLNELNPGWFRFGIPPDPHVDKNGNFTGNTVHFEHLVWLDKWCVKNERTILLDPFLMPRFYEFDLPEEAKEENGSIIINMAARDNRSYARNFVAPMLDYVVNTLNLKSVKYFNPINEPMQYGVYQTPDNTPDALVHYIEMYKEIRGALDDIGITRERIGLIGFDTSHPIKRALDSHSLNVDISPYIEAYSVHHYNLRLDNLPPNGNPDVPRGYFKKGMNITIEEDDRMFLHYARKQGKTLWALEMGTFYYGKFHNPEGVASIDATITVAEGIIRAINVGITAFCIWSLMNPNDVDGHWAVIGEKDGKLVKYKYPFAVYSLIGNHYQSNSHVYPVFPLPTRDSPVILNVHATFMEAPDGEKTMLVVNDDPERTITEEFDLPGTWSNVQEFQISIANAEKLNEPAGTVKAKNGKIKLSIDSFSLLGLKSK